MQVQYAFLELPKLSNLPDGKPDTGASQWAWLFVHAPKLTDVPAELPPGPYREALKLANKATFTDEELDRATTASSAEEVTAPPSERA